MISSKNALELNVTENSQKQLLYKEYVSNSNGSAGMYSDRNKTTSNVKHLTKMEKIKKS